MASLRGGAVLLAGLAALLLAGGALVAVGLGRVLEAMLAAALLLAASGLFLFGVSRAVRPSPERLPRLQLRRLRQMAEMATGAVLICEGERIVAINNAMRALLPGGSRPEGRPLGSMLAGWTVEGVPRGTEAEATLTTASGPMSVRLSKRTILHRNQPHSVIAVSDQRDRLAHEAELRHLHDTDRLTGLASRTRFQAAVAEQLAIRDGAGPAGFTLLVVGLDRFKAVNEGLGHEAGDALLRRVASRLRAVPAGAMVLGRLGGDQFGLLLAEGDPARVQALGTTLIDTLTRWLKAEGAAPNVGVSAGFATAPADANDGATLSSLAELALRRAKEDGRGVCRPYETGLAEVVRRRHELELGLRRALAEGQLEVHFQPQSNLRTGAFDGAEALLRWRHPALGFVEPGEFLPIAEESPLIGEIGEWVLRTACTAALGWPDHLCVAVNLSALQFRRPDLAARFGRILDETGFAPHRLELEVTEGTLIGDEKRTLHTLNELRATGIRIALDDFGTGFSSLSYLRRFPFDKIKLDKSFIHRVADDAGDAAIVTAILTLGHSLGMATTAEGVETERQADFIRDSGCTQAQGFLIGRPVPNAALPDAFRVRLPNRPVVDV